MSGSSPLTVLPPSPAAVPQPPAPPALPPPFPRPPLLPRGGLRRRPAAEGPGGDGGGPAPPRAAPTRSRHLRRLRLRPRRLPGPALAWLSHRGWDPRHRSGTTPPPPPLPRQRVGPCWAGSLLPQRCTSPRGSNKPESRGHRCGCCPDSCGGERDPQGGVRGWFPLLIPRVGVGAGLGGRAGLVPSG